MPKPLFCGVLAVGTVIWPIENIYIKKVEKKKMFGYENDELWNMVIKTYPAVGTFWTYDKAKFLAQPVYCRDFPPCQYCE